MEEVQGGGRKIGREQPLGALGVKPQNLNLGRYLWGTIEGFLNRNSDHLFKFPKIYIF